MKHSFLFCLLLLATSGLAAQQMTSGTLQVGGVERTYLVHVPTGDPSTKALPLVLALHGSGMTSALMAEVTGLNAWADKTGFIVVYPQGLEKHWNTELPPETGGDDFAFMKELLAKMESSYSVDHSRVIAAGYSNGARFGQELGCSDDFQFKAIVAIDGMLSSESARRCVPKHTVRLIQFHGTADPLVPYLGGRVAVTNGPMVISVADDLQLWQRINHCAPDAKTDKLPDNGEDGTHVERIRFHGCAAGGEVTHYRMLGAGHVWPGAMNTPARLGHTTQQIDASRYIAHLVSGEIEP
jgi:polyhydroxybutyrate depolymerase